MRISRYNVSANTDRILEGFYFGNKPGVIATDFLQASVFASDGPRLLRILESGMKRLRAYKTRLFLNNMERTWCRQCAGASRWCYNFGLEAMQTAYAEGRKTSVLTEKKRLNSIKDNVAPWLRDLPYKVLAAAFENLDSAYQNFFRRVKQGGTPGFPKFKSKRNSCQSFNVRGAIAVVETHIKLPRIGWLRLVEHGYLPTSKRVRILSATVSSRDHGATWYVSLQVEEEVPEPEAATGKVLGIDLGIKSLAVLSDGTIYENIKPLRSIERKIGRLSRELARRHQDGANWLRTKAKLNRAHAHARNVRSHWLHQISSETIAKKPSAIVMEDLNVKGMVANHSLARAINDLGMSELRRQMAYKAAWNGIQFILADRWEPSSKVCSNCGVVRDSLGLAERTFVCSDCGFEIDRDLNAALNLAALGSRNGAPSGACLPGELARGKRHCEPGREQVNGPSVSHNTFLQMWDGLASHAQKEA